MPNTQLKCPECERLGTIQILGHIDDLGRIVIRRYHNGVTLVEGSQFNISCEFHGPIYMKERREDGTILNIRSEWIFGQGTFQGTI